MPKISPDGTIVKTKGPELKLPPKTDGKRRTSDWLTAFLDHTAELESPSNYLRWAGLSTIAAVAQRKIYRETQAYTIYPNLYVWLVGPAGDGKSTAIRAGKRLISNIPGVYFTPDAPSVPGVMAEFKDINEVQKNHQSLNAFIGELSSLFENGGESISEFLTAMYDCDPNYYKRTRIGGKESVPYPWLNMLAGTTPSWLGNNLTKNAVEGGLMARIVVVFGGNRVHTTPEPLITKAFMEREKTLIHDLTHIMLRDGPFDWEGGRDPHIGPCTSKCGCGDAYRWYSSWYLNSEGRFPRIPDARTQGYYGRKSIHLLKVATLLSLARRDDKMYRVEDLQAALALLDSIEPGMKKAYSSVGTNPFATDLERIQNQIFSSNGMTYGEIVEANYFNLEESKLQSTIGSLLAMGRICKALNATGVLLYKPIRL